MDNQETTEQKRIRDLEAEVLALKNENDSLLFVNSKLGHSLNLMSEFHLTQDDKENIGNSMDSTMTIKDVVTVYDEYYKLLHNKALGEELAEFQMSEDFKDNIREYLSVAIGYDPISKVGENITIVLSYFNLENKIRNTPKAELREPMVDTLMKNRPTTVESVNNIIDLVNSFNKNTKES